MRPSPSHAPLRPLTRWRRVGLALRAIVRPRNARLSWAAGRVLAGAILACGVIAQALFGWRWWIVVIVLTVGGEAALVAARLARAADREELVDELLDALSPGRGRARRVRRAAGRIRAAPTAAYGLPPSWTGPRYLAGFGTRRPRRGPERTTSVQLGHGDRHAGHGPLLVVGTDAEAWPRHGTADLAERLAHLPPAAAAGPVAEGGPIPPAAAAAPAGAAVAGPGPEVQRVAIPVDGRPVPFDLLADGRRWVARGEVGDLVVTLEGRDLAPASVRLARVADLGPYLADPGV
ncbi:MAG TPA: hypothetical protein VGA45_19035 [Actinomycetota bacterium]